MDLEGYAFNVVWDYEGNIRQFLLRFYPFQEAVEMVDVLKRKVFVKRTKIPGVQLAHLNVGSTVSVLNRQLLVMSFADEITRQAMEKLFQRTVVIFKVNLHMGSVLDSLTSGGLSNLMTVTRIKMLVLQKEEILKLGLVGQCHFTAPSVCAEVTGQDAVKHCQDVLGAISSCFDIQDFCYAAPDVSTADWTLRSIFDKPRANTAICDGSGMLCLIKPHAIREGSLPKIIKHILNNDFVVTAIETVVMNRNSAESFLELYKGVVPEYLAWVDHMASGPSVAMEVRHLESGTYDKFRKLVGPTDPGIAKTIRPDTLRALFGRDKILSAVQCTDLERDCASDLEFMFNYIAK
ncbi:nucleoside diphosphate kinase 7-like [Paramacrobiotus metropolitanus]|uniref:nucleoside diphosphate kinase 7-like n=1 Tax=Paramacrobiotus metropolitanus TaxID=2943436 RepID=UPI002445BDF2|nr:nucleoside diphosphate kinase 7-like [Paramacrobiotus metropolitanus]